MFGGLDGIITTFAVIAAVAGANLDTNIVILMGFANLVGDGISMGFGDYLSSKAEQDFVRNEYKREKWCVRPRGARQRAARPFPPSLRRRRHGSQLTPLPAPQGV